jgi:hypothetical protein
MLGGGNRGWGVGNEPSRSLRGSGVVARLLRSELSAEHFLCPDSVPAREILTIHRGPARLGAVVTLLRGAVTKSDLPRRRADGRTRQTPATFPETVEPGFACARRVHSLRSGRSLGS